MKNPSMLFFSVMFSAALITAFTFNGCSVSTDKENSLEFSLNSSAEKASDNSVTTEPYAEKHRSSIESTEISDNESNDISESENEESIPQTPKEIMNSLQNAEEHYSLLNFKKIACYGRVKSDTENGYFHKGDIIKIVSRWNDKEFVVYATDSGKGNTIEIKNVELLPKNYTVAEEETVVEIPKLPASLAYEEDWSRENEYALPSIYPKDEYLSSDDALNTFEIYYTEDMIKRYGKMNVDIHGYYVKDDIIRGSVLSKGSVVGLISYSIGKPYGFFGIYNKGKSKDYPEYTENDQGKTIDVIDYSEVGNNEKVFGIMDDLPDENVTVEENSISEKPEEAIKKGHLRWTSMTIMSPGKAFYTSIYLDDTIYIFKEKDDYYTCMSSGRVFKIAKDLIVVEE